MSDNMWGDEEPFTNMPEGAQTGQDGKPVPISHDYAPPQVPKQASRTVATPRPIAPPVEVEEVEETEELEPEEDFSDVLSDAHLRLEQGSLYKMIMNHSLFEGIDADPKAVQNVQKEIRAFARERMEVMLGMRQEAKTVEHLEINFPFNTMEIEVLKKLAFTATKGATQNSDEYVPEVRRSIEEVVTTPKRKTLNPIGGSTAVKKSPLSKPLQNKTAPIKRSKLDLTIDQISAETGVPRELLEEKDSLLGRPVHELTAEELIERNRLVSKRRQTQVKSDSAIPMATPAQQEQLAIERVNQMTASSSPQMTRLIDIVKNMPSKN